MKRRLLFGVDDSDFARQAVTEVGSLLKGCDNLDMKIFYGAPDRHIRHLAKLLRLPSKSFEEYEKVCTLEEQNILEQSREALLDSGFGDDKVTAICQSKCRNPVDSMLKLATSESCETIAVSRHGLGSAGRKFMGSVALRLSYMAADRAIWVVDPRNSSRDVLVALVGAPISRKVVEYTVRYFAHLDGCKFTFFHATPPLPPQFWDDTRILTEQEREERERQIAWWMDDYASRVEEFAVEGKERLVAAGVPGANVTFKVQAADRGVARDILAEFEDGNYGILVMGRKGSRDINQFQMGSKANKLLLGAHAFVICLVD